MEVKAIKEERISDDEGAALDEVEVFRVGAIKIEYPLDTYKYKSTTNSGSLTAKTKEVVLDHEPMQPDKVCSSKDKSLKKKIQVDFTTRIARKSRKRAVTVHKRKKIATEIDVNDENETEASDDGSTSGDSSCEEEHSSQDKKIESIDKEKQGNKLNCSTRTRTGEKLFHCDKCPKQFVRGNDLKKHQMRHTGENPFQCDKCSRQFADRSSFKIHQRVHTGEKPFKCDKYPKQFADRTSFINHERVHTGEKPFKCDQCLKRYAQRSSLKTHQVLHTGEKPFHCDKCPKQFADPSNFKRHQRLHTAKKAY